MLLCNYNMQLANIKCNFYLQTNLLIHSGWSVAEGDGVAEAGLSLDGALGYVHDDLRALGAGVEEQREGGQTPTRLDGQAALGLVVASVRCGGKWPVERIYRMWRKKSGCSVWSTVWEQKLHY